MVSPTVVAIPTGGAALAAAILGVLGALAVAADRDWWARVTGSERPPRSSAGRVALLAVSATATGGLLTRPPAASPDATFPLLVVALASLAALVTLEHRQTLISRRAILGVAAALLLLAVIEPPHESSDVWSYAFYGRTVSHYHLSPYTHRPADFPADPTLARVAPGWRAARSVYGPGFTLVSAAITAVAGTSGTLARLGFQGLAALAVLGAALLLARTRVPPAALAAVVLNPLIIVTVVN